MKLIKFKVDTHCKYKENNISESNHDRNNKSQQEPSCSLESLEIISLEVKNNNTLVEPDNQIHCGSYKNYMKGCIDMRV